MTSSWASLNWGAISALVGVTSLVLGALAALWRGIWVMRRNDLVHIQTDIAELKSICLRLEAKLDKHLEWHLNQKMIGAGGGETPPLWPLTGPNPPPAPNPPALPLP